MISKPNRENTRLQVIVEAAEKLKVAWKTWESKVDCTEKLYPSVTVFNAAEALWKALKTNSRRKTPRTGSAAPQHEPDDP